MDVINFGRGRHIVIRPAINMTCDIIVDYGDIWYMKTVISFDYGEVRDYAIRKAEKLGWTDREGAECSRV